jgi:hypothetical protein
MRVCRPAHQVPPFEILHAHPDVNGALDAAVKEKLDNYQHDYNERESVLFIGARFSNLYTSVDTPARGRVVWQFLLTSGSRDDLRAN